MLPTATVSQGFNASSIYAGREFSCVKLSNSYTKCWGRNSRAQLLNSNTTDQTSAAFCKTTITGSHTAAVATITVGSTTGCAAASASGVGKILVGTEVICYTAVGSGTTLTGATRGCDGTTASAYVGGETVLGVQSFGGNGVKISKIAIDGRSGCIITGGGTVNNDRIKCWGTNLNMAANAQSGLHLYTTSATGSTQQYLGDNSGGTTPEIGDNLPFVNH